MLGLIAAAGLSSRLQDLADRRNKVLLDLGGETLLGNLLNQFAHVGIETPYVTVGFGAQAVRIHVGTRAHCVMNPFFDKYGILGSMWVARPFLDGQPFLFTVGDHYFSLAHLQRFLADQPEAEVLVDVEMKTCDDEDMKIFLNRAGKLRTITKTMLDGPCIGEFTGMVRFSADGSKQFFDTLEKQVWLHGIDGYVADILCHVHRKWELAFHLSDDHHRVEVDFPYDLSRAQELYRKEHRARVA